MSTPRATPYPPMSDAVGNAASSIRAIAEAAPPSLGLPAGSSKAALFTQTVPVPTDGAASAWTQRFTGFTRVDGYLATVRVGATYSAGTFYNRHVMPFPATTLGNNPLPISGSPPAIGMALSGGPGFAVPAATYTVDVLAWGV